MALRVDRLHPLFAAEISGVDLRCPPDDQTFRVLHEAFDEHSVLVFRDQDITDEQQVAFSERFGPLERMLIGSTGAGTPLAFLTNVDRKTDQIIPPDDKRMIRNACNMLWHTDSSFKPIPSMASILSGREVPTRDGGTEFASMRLAYADLPAQSRQEIDGQVAIHSFAYSRSLVDAGLLDETQKDEVPPVQQALVRRNPANGRKALYLGSHASHIVGMPVAKGRALLKRLLAHATQDRFVYRHEWRPKDIVMWDNRCVLHRGRPWRYGEERRVMHRTTVAGSGPTVLELSAEAS